MKSANQITAEEQIIGCLLGGALGDAWGGPSEGKRGPIEFEPPSYCTVSDETQLTLATCEAILEHRRVAPESCAARFADLYRSGLLRGVGSSTLKALRDLSIGVHWAVAGARGEYAAGNGAAMRIAPLAFVLDPCDPSARLIISDICRITHHNDEAYAGALAVVLALRAVVEGTWSPQNSFLSVARAGLPDSAVRDRIDNLLIRDLSPSEVAQELGATGHVVDSVPLALYSAQSIATRSIEVVLMETIRAGGDTDTNAAIAGQLAGAVVGVSRFPLERITSIEGGEEVLQIAKRFAIYAVQSVGYL